MKCLTGLLRTLARIIGEEAARGIDWVYGGSKTPHRQTGYITLGCLFRNFAHG